MTSVLDDSDIRAISRDNNWVISGDDPAEAERLVLFVQCIQASSESPDQPSEMDLAATASAAMAAYDQQTAALPTGWQKLLLLQAGYCGIDLDSFEIMDWTHKSCKEHGWGVDGRETAIGCMLSDLSGPLAHHLSQMSRDAPPERTAASKKRWFGR